MASIGPAGENLVRYAAIMNNKHRAAGRCGLGAVMGSKHLKAVACSGTQPVLINDGEGFQESGKTTDRILDESMLKVVFDTFGTNMIATWSMCVGVIPPATGRKVCLMISRRQCRGHHGYCLR